MAKALLTKALICSFADYSPDNNRNDEALPLLDEALSLAKTGGEISLQVEAYYIYSQIYVNKNRWNEKLDISLFNLAQDNLIKGETLADSYNLAELKYDQLTLSYNTAPVIRSKYVVSSLEGKQEEE